MTNILDRVAMSYRPSHRYNRLQLDTPRDVFALALARKLDDGAAAGHYAQLCEQYPADQLLFAFRQSMKVQSAEPLYRTFNANLKAQTTALGSNGRPRIAAIRVERRAVAIVIMQGDNAEWMRVRQLSSAHDKALASVGLFISKTLASFQIKSAALEIVPNGHQFHRSQLSSLITSLLRERAVSITEVHKRTVFESYGIPPARSRKEVRAVIERIYPFESFSGHGGPFLKDALALGLHVQTQRLFIN